MIPLCFRMRITKEGKKPFRLFIPIILVWVVPFVLLAVLSPLIIIAALILMKRRYGKLLLHFYPLFFSTICSLSGLQVQLESDGKKVSIIFI